MTTIARCLPMFLTVAVLSASCASDTASSAQSQSARPSVVGAWQQLGGEERLEFFNDGTYTTNQPQPRQRGGEYTLQNGRLSMRSLDASGLPFSVAIASVSGNELLFSDAAGTVLARFRPSQPEAVRLEAEAEAQRYWNTVLSKCGQSYAAKSYELLGPRITQWTNVTFHVKPEMTSEAERLNAPDVQWRGVAEARGTSRRDEAGLGWSQWVSVEDRGRIYQVAWRARLTKSTGAWTVSGQVPPLSGGPEQSVRVEKVSCNDLPSS
jgi:hypothetical protein